MSENNEAKNENKPAIPDGVYKCGITGMNLGTIDEFPREVAPCTRDGVRAWVRKGISHEWTEAAKIGVAPGFQQGLVGGLIDAMDDLAQHKIPEDVAEHVAWFRGLLETGLVK